SATTILAAVKRRLAAIPHHGIGYGLLKYIAGAPELTGSAAEISFNYLGQWDTALAKDAPIAFSDEPAGLAQSPLNHRTHVIEINALVSGGQLQVFWTYSESLHRRPTIERIANAFVDRLRELVDEASCAPAESVATTTPQRVDSRVRRRDLDSLRR